MLRQFLTHCESQQLLPDYQSAYRANYSCETALVKMCNDMLWSMEKQQVTALISIDLSATFDTVNHDILLKVLTKCFGISGTALQWYEHYLRPRSFKVNIESDYSLAFSVPQGSCAGPILYSAYASIMKEIVPPSIDIHGYADDHALKSSFLASSLTAEKSSIHGLEKLASSVKRWMDQNKLKMNSSKIVYIVRFSSTIAQM